MNKWMALIFVLCLAGLAAPFIRPHDARFYFERGSGTLADLDASSQWSLDWDLRSALADFTRAVHLDPGLAAAYSGRARVETLKGDPASALRDYGSAIGLDPGNPANYLARAELEMTGHEFEGALADYDRVIELEPDNREAYRGRLNVRQMENDPVGVVMERVRMIEETGPAFLGRFGTNAGYFGGRNSYRGRGRMVEALDRALASDTNFAWGYYYRGVYRSLSNDWEGALADFQRCQGYPDARLKDQAAIQSWLARAQAGEKEEADEGLRAYCRGRAPGAAGDWPMQIAGFLLGQSSEAELARAMDPSDTGRQASEYWYYTGMKRLLGGDKSGAEESFRKSLAAKRREYAVYLSAGAELRQLDSAPAAE